jgi:mannose-1-phosphate guanylyltransferase
MTVLPADHSITDLATFHHTLTLGRAYVKAKDHLVTIGIKPNRPETGYGYIRYDREDPEGVKTVRSFEEKPSHEKALAFIKTGEYLWNSGMFLWNTTTILTAISEYLPQVSNTLDSFLAQFKPELADVSIRAFYEAVESISIDYGIMEKADHVKVIPADMGWSDVGSWMAAWELAAKDPQGNYLMGSNIELVDTTNSYIQNSGKHLIAVVGLDNIVVVETEDALLIMPAGKSQQVKQLIEHNLKSYGDTYI